MNDRYELRDLDDQSLPGIRTDSVSKDRKYIYLVERKNTYTYCCYFSSISMHEDLIFPIRNRITYKL